jgi:hypothetical protein
VQGFWPEDAGLVIPQIECEVQLEGSIAQWGLCLASTLAPPQTRRSSVGAPPTPRPLARSNQLHVARNSRLGRARAAEGSAVAPCPASSHAAPSGAMDKLTAANALLEWFDSRLAAQRQRLNDHFADVFSEVRCPWCTAGRGYQPAAGTLSQCMKTMIRGGRR